MYYAMPGLKIYPFAGGHRLRYAVGFSLVLGSGYRSVDFANYGGRNITELVLTHKIYGCMLQNSINVFEHKRLFVGGELGIGTTISSYVGGLKKSNEFLIQGAFKVGYRF